MIDVAMTKVKFVVMLYQDYEFHPTNHSKNACNERGVKPRSKNVQLVPSAEKLEQIKSKIFIDLASDGIKKIRLAEAMSLHFRLQMSK